MTNLEYEKQIAKYRDAINNLDSALIYILAQRFNVVQDIGALKQKYNMNVLDTNRQNTHKENLCDLAQKCNLDLIFIDELFELIMKKAVNEQQKLK